MVINYHAYHDSWVPAMVSGKTMDEAGRATFDGDLLGADPVASFGAIVDRACAAVAALDDEGLERSLGAQSADGVEGRDQA